MKAMVLAAGYGTRFRPATYEIPKPMLPICNRPLIAYPVDSLLGAGVREIVVNLHHLPGQIESYLRSTYGDRCRFIFSFEPRILGTGGGVRKMRAVLEAESEFYLVNGDTIQSPPFEKLHRPLLETGALASLLLRRPPPNDRFTSVMFDGRFVTGFGSGPGEALMFAGAHAVSRRIFDRLPDRDFSGLTEDVYMPALKGADKIAGIVYDGLWFDIGTPRRYLEASLEMLTLIAAGQLPMPESSRISVPTGTLVGASSDCPDSALRSVIGSDCRTAADATVEHSVLWNEVIVGQRASVDRSILGHKVAVPAGSRVKNALLCRALPRVEYDEGVAFFGDLVGRPVDADQPLIVEVRGS